jgi:uroporphyrinogen-III decarboxylase
MLRNGTAKAITEAVAQCHRDAGAHFIVGAGCEIPRDTPPANLQALCDYARLSSP